MGGSHSFDCGLDRCVLFHAAVFHRNRSVPISFTTSSCRSIGYYLEGLVCLAPFAKKPFNITLTGITNDDKDISVCA
jgi:hypothetical protein